MKSMLRYFNDGDNVFSAEFFSQCWSSDSRVLDFSHRGLTYFWLWRKESSTGTAAAAAAGGSGVDSGGSSGGRRGRRRCCLTFLPVQLFSRYFILAQSAF